MNELFKRHDGRKVNTWGDAVIAEFSSVVEAVRCGVEIQDAIGAENRGLPFTKQMWFRIGINLGDVMQDGTDLYGDGVNVASRLELLADPGGIMVATVYDLTHKQLSFAYDFAGEQKVKGQQIGSSATACACPAATRHARPMQLFRWNRQEAKNTAQALGTRVLPSRMHRLPSLQRASTSCGTGISASRKPCASRSP